MAFAPRTRATIRGSILADWAARYQALTPAQVLLTVPGSDAYMWADALAVELELFENQALAQTRAVLPDQADTASLDRHGGVDGVAREAATAATLQVEIHGTPAAVVTFGASVLTYNGVSYGAFQAPLGTFPASVVIDGGGNATVYCTATTTGVATTLAPGTVLQWSSTPAGATATADVVAIQAAGQETESDGAYAARIILRRQSRPASGNRSDWQAWVEAYSGVDQAYVYPLLQPPAAYPGAGTVGVLGCVTVLAFGPIATGDDGLQTGDAVPNTRILGTAGSSLASTVGAYIEGTLTAEGDATSAGTQLRPVTMSTGDYSVEVPSTTTQNVELQCTWSTATTPPWAYNAAYTVAASVDGSSFSITGNVEAVLKPAGTPLPILVKILNAAATVVRGDYHLVTPTTVVFNGGSGNTDLTLGEAFPGGAEAVVASVVLPAPTNWQAIRLATFAYFDTLGPGDTSPASRWPSDDERGRATLYKSALTGSVVQRLDPNGALLSGVRGVLSATSVAPAADTTPAAKTLLVLGTLAAHV